MLRLGQKVRNATCNSNRQDESCTMPFSHHSHSGEFCNHASDKLEDVIREAIRQKMQVLALTEHMPRNREEDLYPGEVCVSIRVLRFT